MNPSRLKGPLSQRRLVGWSLGRCAGLREYMQPNPPAEQVMTTHFAMEMKMPWTADQPPPSMRNLPPKVRRKAVEIANALLRERMDEAKAIRIATAKATAKARAWALEQQHLSEPESPP